MLGCLALALPRTQQIVIVHKMAETEKEDVEFTIYQMWQGKLRIRWQHLIFNFIIYIVQRCKNCNILQIHWTVGPKLSLVPSKQSLLSIHLGTKG